MSKINHENIDKWLFDSIEGNLTGSQQRELQSFLKANPEYREDLAAWQNSTLENTSAGEYVYANELNEIARPSYTRYAVAATVLVFMLGSSVIIYNSYNGDDASVSVAEDKNNGKFTNENSSPVFIAQHFVNKISENTFAENTVPVKDENSVFTNADKNTNSSDNANASISENNPAVNNNNNNNNNNGQPVINNNIKNGNGVPLINNNAIVNNNRINGNPVKHVLVNNSNDPVNGISVENNSSNPEIKNTPADFSTLDLSPGLAFSEFFSGTEAASTAFDVLKAKRDAMNDNQIVLTPEEYAAHKQKYHIQSRKNFFDPELGFYNNRDHTLLHPGNLNPVEYAGFAGSSVSPAFQVNYRNQWTGNANNSSTYKFAYDQYSRKLGTAWGVAGSYNDFANGMYTSATGMFILSPKIKPGKYNKHLTIEPGIIASYTQNTLNPSKIQPGLDIEPRRGFVTTLFENQVAPTRTSLGYFDLSMSTLVNTKHFYAVAGVDNIVNPSDNLYSNGLIGATHLPRKFKAAIGTDFKQDLQSAILLSPQVSFMHQGDVTEVWAGSLLQYDIINIDRVVSFNIGAAVSSNKQFTSTIGMKAGIFKVGYQFDVTKSYLTGAYYGSHEATLRISLHGLQKKNAAILNESGIPEK